MNHNLTLFLLSSCLLTSSAWAGPFHAVATTHELDPGGRIPLLELEHYTVKITNGREEPCHSAVGHPREPGVVNAIHYVMGEKTIQRDCPIRYAEFGSEVLMGVLESIGAWMYANEYSFSIAREEITDAKLLKFVAGLGWRRIPGTYTVSLETDSRNLTHTQGEIDCGSAESPFYRPRFLDSEENIVTRKVCGPNSRRKTLQERIGAGEMLEDGFDGQIIVVNKKIGVLQDTRTTCEPAPHSNACNVTSPLAPVCTTLGHGPFAESDVCQ